MNKHMHKTTKRYSVNNQTGVVSFFVTLIMMVVLSIIVIGFSQISRRETRAALNRQLSTEAFYAAESGFNDAYSIITTALANNNLQSSPSSCSSAVYPSPESLNSSGSNQYTCIIVNTQPSTLSFTPGTGQASVADLISSNGKNFSKLNIEWDSSTNPGGYGAGCNGVYSSGNSYIFDPSSFTGGSSNPWPAGCPPVLRVDLVPMTFPVSEASLSGAVKTFFLYPQNFGPTATFSNIKSGESLPTTCSSNCLFSVNLPGNDSEYWIRMMYIYNAPPVIKLSATDISGTAVNFKNAEAEIDSTGKAFDVLRRIQVDVSLNPSNGNIEPPNYEIQTDGTLCKRLEVGKIGNTDTATLSLPAGFLVPADELSTQSTIANGKNDLSSNSFLNAPLSQDACNPL